MFDRVIKESCPNCGHTQMEINFSLREGHHARAYIECGNCHSFVARYILHAYVDPSFQLQNEAADEQASDNFRASMRGIAGRVQKHQERARSQFETIKTRLEAEEAPDDRIVHLIRRNRITEDG